MLVFFDIYIYIYIYIYLPLVKETSHCGKNPSVNNEHLCTAGHAKITNLTWKRDASAPYPYVSLPLCQRKKLL